MYYSFFTLLLPEFVLRTGMQIGVGTGFGGAIDSAITPGSLEYVLSKLARGG